MREKACYLDNDYQMTKIEANTHQIKLKTQILFSSDGFFEIV